MRADFFQDTSGPPYATHIVITTFSTVLLFHILVVLVFYTITTFSYSITFSDSNHSIILTKICEIRQTVFGVADIGLASLPRELEARFYSRGPARRCAPRSTPEGSIPRACTAAKSARRSRMRPHQDWRALSTRTRYSGVYRKVK